MKTHGFIHDPVNKKALGILTVHSCIGTTYIIINYVRTYMW